MSPEPAIIDTTVIQVKSTTQDSYGNLIVTPVEGEDVKVSEKRKQLFDVFQPGNMVKLYWAEYMHKKYVARAEREEQGVSPVVKEAIKLGAKVITDDPKLRSMSISYSKDLVVAGKIELTEIGKYANMFLNYILNIKKAP